MTDSIKIEAYIGKQEEYGEALAKLREILSGTEMVETVKWGIPTYTVNGKNVIGFAAFKAHFGVWFFQGVFLKDTAKVLVNAQEGTTKGMRQLKYEHISEINEKLLLVYAHEAIENEKLGKRIKPQKKGAIIVPHLLEEAFSKNSKLKDYFNKLAPYKQREYTEHISSAKREATQLSRLEKSEALILEGKGLHDKYKKC